MNTPTPSQKFDIRDLFFFGGLAVAGAGGVMISVSWTLVVLGSVLAMKAHGPIVMVREAE